eukprot:349914-Chlamydomonas_euryale.AAC.5
MEIGAAWRLEPRGDRSRMPVRAAWRSEPHGGRSRMEIGAAWRSEPHGGRSRMEIGAAWRSEPHGDRSRMEIGAASSRHNRQGLLCKRTRRARAPACHAPAVAFTLHLQHLAPGVHAACTPACQEHTPAAPRTKRPRCMPCRLSAAAARAPTLVHNETQHVGRDRACQQLSAAGCMRVSVSSCQQPGARVCLSVAVSSRLHVCACQQLSAAGCMRV